MGGGGIAEWFIPPELRDVIDDLKESYPDLLKRIERIEAEIHAISYVLAKQNPDLWAEAVEYAEGLIRQENMKLEAKKARRRGRRN